MISANVEGNVKQQQTKPGSYTSNFLSEVPSPKFEIQCRTNMCFSFNSAWYSIYLHIVC